MCECFTERLAVSQHHITAQQKTNTQRRSLLKNVNVTRCVAFALVLVRSTWFRLR